MKKRLYSCALTAALLLLAFPGKAQEPKELLRFSNYDWSFGTARSAAMGGAFSSLGADFSSLALNPAGLGMYRRSELGFSMSFTTLNTESTFSDRATTRTDLSRDRFAFNNAGAVFNLYNGSGALTSLSFGFSYNKLADFNTKADIAGLSNTSLADYFAGSLNSINVAPEQIESILNQNTERYMPYFPAMLGYMTYIVDYDDARGAYVPSMTGDAYSNFSQLIQTKGSIGQYDLSVGMNFTNKFYLGLGFGIQDIYYNEFNSYYEIVENNNNNDDEYALDEFEYSRNLKQTGTAWNFKIGAIIRPVEELRIGIAFHTPTYVSLDENYTQSAYSLTGVVNNGHEYSDSKYLYGPFSIKSPMRLLLGTSYVFYETAILSIDYERVWYNKMKLYDGDDWNRENTAMTAEVKNLFKPVNNLRVGLEAQLAPNWFGRLGFAYYQGMYKKQNLRGDRGMFDDYKGQKLNYSGGFGYRTPYWGIDLAYIYMDTKDSPAYIYDYSDNDRSSKAYRTRGQRHNVTLTTSWRF